MPELPTEHSPERSPELSLAATKPSYSKREASRMQILSAARELVTEIGYPAVTMTLVANRSKVSRATLYRYYSTKEQLYSDVSVQWGVDFIEHMRLNPPKGDTVGERVSAVIRETVTASATSPRLMTAYIATMIADDATLQTDQRRLKMLMPGIINVATDELSTEDLALTASTLQHVLISNLILLNSHKTQTSKIIDEMERIASRLLVDIWDKP